MQKQPYQTPRLEPVGRYMVMVGGSPIRVPIQGWIPDFLDWEADFMDVSEVEI